MQVLELIIHLFEDNAQRSLVGAPGAGQDFKVDEASQVLNRRAG